MEFIYCVRKQWTENEHIPATDQLHKVSFFPEIVGSLNF